MLILSLKESSEERRPAIVFMHGTNTNKEWLRPWLEVNYTFDFSIFKSIGSIIHILLLIILNFILIKAYASRGYVAIGLDSRYHGERADCKTAYRDVNYRCLES